MLPDALTTTGGCTILWDPKEWETLLHPVEKHGYVFVDPSLLLHDYDGSNGRLIAFHSALDGDLTWWTRYFDWI